MKLSYLQEQILLEQVTSDEDAIEYISNFVILLERKFGKGLLDKGNEDFNQDEEMFVRHLSRAVEEFGGNIPKEKLGLYQKVILVLMAPVLGIHFSTNFGNLKPNDIAYVLSNLEKKQIQQISKRLTDFVDSIKH